MTLQVKPPATVPDILPETAPFSAEQRQWLNGFFAGLLALDKAAAKPLTGDQAASLLSPPAEEEPAPWHDPSMAIADRMALAEGEPLKRRMFAAMAQQNCGQCGYLCETYSTAIAEGKEPRLNLCAPGGKDTLRMLKVLAEEMGAPAAVVEPVAAAPVTAVRGRARENPATAHFLGRRLLNKAGSEKATHHIDIDLSDSGLDYVVGDSLGVFPKNDPRLVDAVIGLIGARPDASVHDRSLRDVLIDARSLGAAPDSLFQLISYVSGGVTRQKAKQLASGDDPDGDLDRLDVLGALHKFNGIRIGAEAFVEALDELQPRLYSISSSYRARPGQVSLTVDSVRYTVGQRPRWGVASTYLGERIQPGEPLRVYVQRAHGFALPADPSTPIIMVGPGTGVAPFRAFLQERVATGAPGRNWLFFGHQRRDCDFFYEEEWASLQDAGALNRLTLAWSRDGAGKVYVQDRMREVSADLWAWLRDGAHFYVCGDAKRMARDVERAMVDVAAAHGGMDTEAAVAFVAGLKRSGRYQADVY